MDGQQFDRLVQALGQGMTRRGVFAVLGGLLAAGVSEVAAKRGHNTRTNHKKDRKQQRRHGEATAQADCDPQTQCCSPSFPVHCGTRSDGSPACCNVGTQCCPQGSSFICCSLELNPYCCANNFCCLQHQTCSAVGCAGCPTGQTTCPSDRTTCVDLQTDPNNCGSCGKACTGGSTCVDGSCICQSPTPDVCGGQCVDLQTDPNNCGSCGNDCQGGAQCVEGSCRECLSGDPPCGEQCCDSLLGEVCVSNFGNPICCAPAKVCGGGCCDECCVSNARGLCGTSCGPRCCPDGKSCVTSQKGGKTHYRCR